MTLKVSPTLKSLLRYMAVSDPAWYDPNTIGRDLVHHPRGKFCMISDVEALIASETERADHAEAELAQLLAAIRNGDVKIFENPYPLLAVRTSEQIAEEWKAPPGTTWTVKAPRETAD